MKKFFSALVFSSFLVSTISSIGTSAEKMLSVDINVNSDPNNSKKTENMNDGTTKTCNDKGNMFVHPGQTGAVNPSPGYIYIYNNNNGTENMNSDKSKYIYLNNKPEEMKKEEESTCLVGNLWNSFKKFCSRFAKNALRIVMGGILLWIADGNETYRNLYNVMAKTTGVPMAAFIIMSIVNSSISLFL